MSIATAAANHIRQAQGSLAKAISALANVTDSGTETEQKMRAALTGIFQHFQSASSRLSDLFTEDADSGQVKPTAEAQAVVRDVRVQLDKIRLLTLKFPAGNTEGEVNEPVTDVSAG